MTNEVAIRYCDEYLARHISDIDKEFLKKAKEALQQQPCDKCAYSTSEGCQYDDITETIPPFEDCISRQAAIDKVDSETVSTNPEHFKSSEKFIKFMNDADIASFGKWQWANGFNTALVTTTIRLKKLPSAQPKTGHWIDITNKRGTVIAAKCSCCKNYPKHAIKSDYCPNCGAKMTEGGTE